MDLFRICALIILALFYSAYFVKQVILRRQGIATNRLSKGEKPLRTYYVEICLLITTYSMAVIQCLSIVFYKQLTPILESTIIQGIGIALACTGVLFFMIAIVTMRDSWRAGIDRTQQTKMVDKGIYSMSRNPAFVGFDLLYIGMALAFSNIVHIIVALVAIVLMHLQILEEEKFLPTVFGSKYDLYKAKTPRYFWFL